ncbi:PAS domain-containing sensor histidine kinase [Candidatus Saccharibacteria bacterium]|nr:PAS domain-containing sensor histidine kinase [Candidatus Saccharibacteria bacterium]
MNLFKSKNTTNSGNDSAALAEIALRSIHDGVVMTDKNGQVQFINPAAITMTECGSSNKAIGLDYGLIIKLETKEGRELPEAENPLIQAMKTGQPLDGAKLALISLDSGKRIPIAISVSPVENVANNRIITFRNITKELEEEGEQTEFISTASHEMRTPVATIDGYLSLCLNPQTATLDERARGYLTAAQAASRHLGKLFQNLLDVTKLDDGKIRPHFEPVEMVSLVKAITDDYLERARTAKITFNFGSSEPVSFGENRRMEQVVYGFVDINFMREILDNLIENALKYTPEGGSVYVNVRGDGDRALINVTDTGIGISADDLAHIFQKFYRADNSDTREIGGTGLGLYLVKQRAEAMGGRVWAESAFGEGSTFFVSLPRITSDEYEKRMIMVRNQRAMQTPAPQPISAPIAPSQPISAPPAPTPSAPPAPPNPQVTSQPVQPNNINLNGVIIK